MRSLTLLAEDPAQDGFLQSKSGRLDQHGEHEGHQERQHRHCQRQLRLQVSQRCLISIFKIADQDPYPLLMRERDRESEGGQRDKHTTDRH